MKTSRDDGSGELIELAVRAIGPAPDQVVRLREHDSVSAANFEYADLLSSRTEGRRVRAVVQKDGSPLVYVAAGTLDGATAGENLAQLLANRAETSILLEVVSDPVSPGLRHSRVWPCRLDVKQHRMVDLDDPIQASRVLGDLQDGLWADSANSHQEQRLRDLLVRSVRTVSAEFVRATKGAGARGGDEALALVGRALFTRFLLDRNILTDTTAPDLWPMLGNDGAAAFSGPRQAAAVFRWLDVTFNGDFMPLPAEDGYEAYFNNLASKSPDALKPLSWIVAKTDAGGQLPLWEKLDFSHIPVGTLSEVYEDYAHKQSPREAKKTSVHFTPRHIARMMVRQAMAGLSQEEATAAKVLDPAVGAGVFLSLAYRELARHRALADGGCWPTTDILRDILYEQLCGLDVNASALKLSALTLYLTAIELDANPVPPEKLKFKKALLGSVLHDVSDQDKVSNNLGSLKPGLSINADYSIVIGNPPWTSSGAVKPADDAEEDDEDESEFLTPGKKGSFVQEVEAVARRCIAQRRVRLDAADNISGLGQKNALYEHPDKVPDLAFVWKAAEWARPGGIICLVVAQRLLIKRSRIWRNAREALFKSVQIDGILDASEFANHKSLLWPGIEHPFCVLFARNVRPNTDHATQLLTLTVEPTLERRRQLRVDPLAPTQVRVRDFDRSPGGIVPRTRGCELDHALLQRWEERRVSFPVNLSQTNVRRFPLVSLGSYLESISTGRPKRGFKRGQKGAKFPDWFKALSPDARQVNLKAKIRWAGEIPASAIEEPFQRTPLKSGPEPAWYEPPLLLLKQAMGKLGDLERSVLITPDSSKLQVLFPFGFVGAPLLREPEALLAAKYVSLWVNSCIFSYYQTLTSTQFGFGIKTLNSDEIEAMPLVPLSTLLDQGITSSEEIERLFSGLALPKIGSASQIDSWACQILGCDEFESELIRDTLSIAYPIGESRNISRSWVSESGAQLFIERLRREISDASEIIEVDSLGFFKSALLPGWRFVCWKLKDQATARNGACTLKKIEDISLLRLVRESYPAGQVWGTTADGQQVFGQLALPRYWLPSRAGLAAQLIVAWADQFST